jgi:potassium efflux system protein
LLIWQGTLRIKKTLNSIFSSDNEWQLMVKSRLNQLLPFASTILAATSIYYGLKLILLGPSGTTLVCGLYMVIALGLAGRWLSKVIFSGDELNEPLFKMADNNADTAVNNVGLLGWVLGAFFLFKNVFALNSNENNFILAPNFLLIIIASVALFRFAGIANKFEQNRGLDGDLSFRQMSLRFLARIIKLISIVGPVIAAIGYYEASIALVYPIIETLLALGVVLIAHTYASELLNITWSRDEGENTLTAGFLRTLIGIILICIAIPCIALFWGARTTDLTEFWNWLQNGFQFGDARLTPTNLITFVVIFVLGYMITKLIQRGLKDSILPNTRLDAGGKNAVLAVTSYFGIFVVAMIAITAAGIDLSGLAIVAGALSVGIGFGLQAIVSNFVSGIILLIERPIKQGDWVDVGGYSGYVRSINVRSTMIDTFDRATVIVPNSDLIAGTVTNWTHNSDNGRVIVPVGVAYGSDPRRVEEVLREIAESHPRILPGSTPSVVFKQFGADSMDFEIRVILTDVNYLLSVKSEMNYEIFKRFKEEGIEIPFAQRDIHLRDIDKLTDALSGKSKK